MPVSALWTRNFSLYFTARVVSLLGDAMMPVAAALAVGAVYGVTVVGLVLSLWTAPFVLLVLFGGVFADRIGARPMMVGADVVRVITQGTVAAAFFLGTPPLWLLLLTSVLAGAATAMFQPGVNSMVPLVASDPQRANATLKVADSMAQLIGPALAGGLIVLAGGAAVFALDGGTFAISGLCLLLLRLAKAPAPAVRHSILSDLRVGWGEFRSRTWMWSVILVWVVYGVILFGPLIPLGSSLISARLGQAAYGWVISSLGAGTIAGGLLAMRMRPAHPLRAGALAMFGFALIPLSIVSDGPLPVLVAGHVVGGMAWAFWSVMWSTSVQTQVAGEVLNRVTAYEVAGSVAGVAFGEALAGPMAGIAGARSFLTLSTVVCVLGCLTLLVVPAIRGLRRVPAYSPGGSQ